MKRSEKCLTVFSNFASGSKFECRKNNIVHVLYMSSQKGAAKPKTPQPRQ